MPYRMQFLLFGLDVWERGIERREMQIWMSKNVRLTTRAMQRNIIKDNVFSDKFIKILHVFNVQYFKCKPINWFLGYAECAIFGNLTVIHQFFNLFFIIFFSLQVSYHALWCTIDYNALLWRYHQINYLLPPPPTVFFTNSGYYFFVTIHRNLKYIKPYPSRDSTPLAPLHT